ncbi:MAG TPA: hypothetical protein VN794_05415 [Methylomirabilota bacterium]|jgi:hypothetical protein|nr:hypothetical protein [Methylomirabilota bacterium]
MNLEELQKKLLAAARGHAPEERVPYLFEKRVMARLLGQPIADVSAQWAGALWRAAAPCVAIMLFLAAWSFFAPDARSAGRQSTIDLAQEFENTLMAAADPETPPTDSTR